MVKERDKQPTGRLVALIPNSQEGHRVTGRVSNSHLMLMRVSTRVTFFNFHGMHDFRGSFDESSKAIYGLDIHF